MLTNEKARVQTMITRQTVSKVDIGIDKKKIKMQAKLGFIGPHGSLWWPFKNLSWDALVILVNVKQ